MSQFRTENMVCPACNKKDTIRLYERIESTDAAARNKLLKGSLFRYKCPKCGYVAGIAGNLLYHNAEKNFMVYFAADHDVEGMKEAMDDIEARANKMAPSEAFKYKVRRRIVVDNHELVEKVIILEADLDDRTIELMKMFYLDAVKENHPEMDIMSGYFCIVDDEWHLELVLIDGRTFAIKMQKDLYQTFEDEYREEIDRVGETYFVNADYAINIYGENLSDPD